MRKTTVGLLMVTLLITLAICAHAAVELYQVTANTVAPAFVDYKLNCPADVTVKILPCDVNGIISGPAIREVTLPKLRGPNRFIWMGDKDDLTNAPVGYYVAQVSATSNQQYWDPIVGVFTYNQIPPTTETTFPAPGMGDRSLPDPLDGQGFYDIAVNTREASPYYGRIYVSDKQQTGIFMYGPDGEFLGKLDDSQVVWLSGDSCPWTVSVADDDFVYVTNRSTRRTFCFNGAGALVSSSPNVTASLMDYTKGAFARVDAATGITHLYFTGGKPYVTGTTHYTVSADHLTFAYVGVAYNSGTNDEAYGMWVSPDFKTAYQANHAGALAGVTKWDDPDLNGVFVRDAAFLNAPSSPAKDVTFVDGPTPYLWVTRQVPYTTDDTATTDVVEYSRSVGKYDPLTGALIADAPYDVVRHAHLSTVDAVGNLVVTFAKNSPTWPQYYWGMFAEEGTYTCSTKTTVVFYLSAQPAPVIIPNSAVWTPDNEIKADDSDSASVTFKVLDVNGYADITSVKLDLAPLGYASDQACTLAKDPGDTTDKIKTATVTGIKAKVGARCTTSPGQAPHYLVATATDSTAQTNIDSSEIKLKVTGVLSASSQLPALSAYTVHSRNTGWNIASANIVAVGGGIPGATDPRAAGPFTYTSLNTVDGFQWLETSAGQFNVVGKKVGFGDSEVVPVDTAMYSDPEPAKTLYLQPLTIAEAKDLVKTPNGTMANVEAVCYAPPMGLNPTLADGLYVRTDTQAKRNQWYMCDPDDPANGMVFMVTQSGPGFFPQWDNVLGKEPPPRTAFTSYMGKRPALGETIMVTGLIDMPPGHERRVLLQNTEIINAIRNSPSTITQWYYNAQPNPGVGLPTTPVTLTIPQIYTPITQSFSEHWGKFAQVTDATVIAYNAAGEEVGVAVPPTTDPVPYLTIANVAGNTTMVAIDMPTSLGSPTIPAIGGTYTFTGAVGRRARYGGSALRVRGAGDMVLTTPAPAAPSPLSVIRTLNDNDPVNISGIVVHKAGTSMWIEAADRSVGIRVRKNYSWVTCDTTNKVGDIIQVVGTMDLWDGEMTIVPTLPAIVLSSGNPWPGVLDIRSREIGGNASGTTPGVTNGRGALNVGLKVHFSGMVTAVDPAATKTWYYLWDGANRADQPVSDGSGNIGIHVEAAPPAGCVPWQTWVDVTAVVGTDGNFVAGSVIPTLLPTATATKVTAFDTITAASGTALTALWNLMSVPAVPAATGTGGEWDAKSFEPYVVFSPTADPNDIDGRMYRWENCTGSLYLWDQWSEVGSHGPFGAVVLGDGYWMQLDADKAVSYSGRNSALDQWTGICSPGWMIIGHPKDHNVYLDEVKVHDGGAVYSMYDAIMSNLWIDCTGFWWDNSTQSLTDVGIPDCWCSSDTLLPWHGYWIQTYQGDLALITPEATEWPRP